MGFTQREARRLIRKSVSRVPEGENITHLNIMPMMDMMTILLVAFIFQAATSATALTAGTVTLPRTLTADELKEDTATLIITPIAIVIEGKSIVGIHDGDVDPADKEGGSLGLKITNVTKFLAVLHQGQVQKQLAADPNSKDPPELLIIADRTTPFHLLIEVMFSAKQQEAGYKRFRLIVQKQFPNAPKTP